MKLSAQAQVAQALDNALTTAMVRHQKAYEKMEELKRELVDVEKAVRLIEDLQKALPTAAREEYKEAILARYEAYERAGR